MEEHGRVLIVDDNPMNVNVLRRLLRKHFELDAAASGEDCLARLAEFKPHLVLLDIMMPGMDGYETCRRIKSSPLGDFIQVMLVSGKGRRPTGCRATKPKPTIISSSRSTTTSCFPRCGPISACGSCKPGSRRPMRRRPGSAVWWAR